MCPTLQPSLRYTMPVLASRRFKEHIYIYIYISIQMQMQIHIQVQIQSIYMYIDVCVFIYCLCVYAVYVCNYMCVQMYM